MWAWGSNAYGQLGWAPTPTVRQQAKPSPIVLECVGARQVAQVACGLYHTVCLTADGLVFSWGRNVELQLGHAGPKSSGAAAAAAVQVDAAQVLEGLEDMPVQQIACGRYHTAVLTTAGAIMEWGWGEQKAPRLVEGLLGLPIRQLACGVYTTIALTSDGQVYTWEARKLGQAGYAPQLVEALQDKGVVKLACGLWDVMALTEDGEVYTWTDHSWSPFNSNKVIPSLVTALSGQGITDIVCGKAFSVALTDGGDVWSWPKGREDEAKPMEALRDKGVRMLACGDTHTVALATVGWRDECTVFTSGLNDYNQLGSVKDRTTDEPSAVDDLENMSFCQVACGGYHTVALTGPWMGLSSDLVDDLAAILHSGQMADYEFVVDGRSFPVHKIILAARCSHLALAETDTTTRVEMNDVTAEIFGVFLEFVYKDRCRVSRANGKALLSLAERFGVPRLARLCHNALSSTTSRGDTASPLERLGNELLQVLDRPQLSDITFLAEGHRIQAHRAIVAARCPYFKALWHAGMRESEERELSVGEIEAGVFTDVMKYIYSGQVEFNPDTVVELMAAANQYQLVQLKRRCEKYIIQAIDEDNVESLREAGELYGAPLLVSCCKRFVSALVSPTLKQQPGPAQPNSPPAAGPETKRPRKEDRDDGDARKSSGWKKYFF